MISLCSQRPTGAAVGGVTLEEEVWCLRDADEVDVFLDASGLYLAEMSSYTVASLCSAAFALPAL